MVLTSTGADTDLAVTMGITKDSTVEIDTSLFSADFKAAFKLDSLGEFTKAGTDHAKFSIDCKNWQANKYNVSYADANTRRHCI